MNCQSDGKAVADTLPYYNDLPMAHCGTSNRRRTIPRGQVMNGRTSNIWQTRVRLKIMCAAG